MLHLSNGASSAVPQVLSEERQELHATLNTQDTYVKRVSLERQKLCNETARLNQVLQAKDQVIRWVYFYHVVQQQYTRGHSMLVRLYVGKELRAMRKVMSWCFLSSLEDCLAAQGCAGVETLRQDLEETTAKLHCAQACEVHLKAEVACLKER